MEFVELIACEVAHRCEAPGVEGVRISPIRLEAAEVPALIAAVKARLGGGLHLAISVPGIPSRDEDQLSVSEGEEAARRATEWRNKIDSAAGARLVYISTHRHGRAGGLEETLVPITDSELRGAFAREAAAIGLPEELLAGLEKAKVLDKVPGRKLCEFSEAVQQRDDKFAAAGEHLHIIGLARDTGLEAGEVVERLSANAKHVHAARAAERASGPDELRKELNVALRRGVRDDLGSVDVGRWSTTELTATKASKRKKSTKKRKKAKKRRTKEPGKGRSTEVDEEPGGEDAAAATRDRQAELLEGALGGTRKEREATLGGLGSAVNAPSVGGGEDSNAQREQEELARALGVAVDADHPGVFDLVQAMVAGEGCGVTYDLRGAADLRGALNVPLPGGVEPAHEEVSCPALEPALERWRLARREVATLLGAGSQRERGSLQGLVRAPLIALYGEGLRESAAKLLDAATSVYAEASKLGDQAIAASVMALDTATLVGGGAQLTLLSPLHPLWLGQALARLEQIRAYKGKFSHAGARLVARAVSRAPSAPQTFRVPSAGEARLAPVIAGLICYEARPALAEDAALTDIGERLVRAFMRVHPYASLGLRVRLHGDAPAALVEGLARPLAEEGALARLEVRSSAVPGPLKSAASRAALEEGRLSLLPAVGSPASPHLEVTLGPAHVGIEDDTPATAGIASYAPGPLATTFTQFRGGLRAITSVAGVPGVEEFEALHAAASGWEPHRAFIVEPRGVSLSAALRDVPANPGAWRVVIGQGVARNAPQGDRLLAHEAMEDGLTVAIVCDTAEPASRSLEAPLRSLEVTASSPRVRRMLADRLCDTGRGLLAIGRSQSTQLAGLILEAALRREAALTCDHVTVAQLRGQSLMALTDADPDWDEVFAVCAGVAGGECRLFVGYSAIDEPLDVDVARGGHLQGSLADLLGTLLESVELVISGSGVAKSCASESLSWALCGAAAEEPPTASAALLAALSALGDGGEVPVSTSVLLPPAHPLSDRLTPARLKGKEVTFTRLDAQLLDKLILVAP